MNFPDGTYDFEIVKSEVVNFNRSVNREYIMLTLAIMNDGPYKYMTFKHPIFNMNPEYYERNLRFFMGYLVEQYRLTDSELMHSASALMFGRKFNGLVKTEKRSVDGLQRRYLVIP